MHRRCDASNDDVRTGTTTLPNDADLARARGLAPWCNRWPFYVKEGWNVLAGPSHGCKPEKRTAPHILSVPPLTRLVFLRLLTGRPAYCSAQVSMDSCGTPRSLGFDIESTWNPSCCSPGPTAPGRGGLTGYSRPIRRCSRPRTEASPTSPYRRSGSPRLMSTACVKAGQWASRDVPLSSELALCMYLHRSQIADRGGLFGLLCGPPQ